MERSCPELRRCPLAQEVALLDSCLLSRRRLERSRRRLLTLAALPSTGRQQVLAADAAAVSPHSTDLSSDDEAVPPAPLCTAGWSAPRMPVRCLQPQCPRELLRLSPQLMEVIRGLHARLRLGGKPRTAPPIRRRLTLGELIAEAKKARLD